METTDETGTFPWLRTYADHVRKRFGSRVVVAARVEGREAVVLSQIYALERGGLVLKVCCDDDEHEHRGESRHGGGHEDEGHEDEHGDDSPRPGHEEQCGHELWVASPEHVVFDVRCAEEGELCTGFGFLGLSRTPQVLVPRGTEPPPKPDHHHGGF